MKKLRLRCCLLVAATLMLPIATSSAHDSDGTLEEIAKRGEFRIGYRTDAAPLSYENAEGVPSGYSVDLCRRIAAAVKTYLGRSDIETKFVPVTSDNRIDAVSNGDVDIECGSTTLTLSRQEQVDFTLMTFVTGGSILSLAENNVPTLSDLAGKKVGVVQGTTTMSNLTIYLERNLIDANIVSVTDRTDGMAQLNRGDIAAFASDQIVLIGQVIEALNPNRYSLAEDTFSYEPYAFVVRRNDAEFRLVANRALTQIYRSGQHVQIFNKWIGRIGIRPPPVLVAMYQLNVLPE